MRLWHVDLIPFLPDMQLRGQHRECCALRGNGWGRRHSTVDYVFEYSIFMLYSYHMYVMDELLRRGVNIDSVWYDYTYRGKAIGHVSSEEILEGKYLDRYEEHNLQYLLECIRNLSDKNVKFNY